MKKIILLGFSSLIMLFSSISAAKKGGPQGTIEILHKPDDQAIVITINRNALEAHIAHGDCVFDDDDDGGDARNSDVDDAPNCADMDDDDDA